MGASGEDARAGGRRVPRHLTEAARLNSRIPRSPEGVGGGCGVLRVLGRINPRATHATYNERRAETTTGAWLAGPRGEPVPDRSHAGPSYDYARAAIDVRGASAGAVPRERRKRRLGFADACGMAAPRALPLARRRAEVYASASDDRVGRTVWAAFALLGSSEVTVMPGSVFVSSTISSSPRRQCVSAAATLHIVAVGMYKAASLPSNSAAYSCSALTVGSSP